MRFALLALLLAVGTVAQAQPADDGARAAQAERQILVMLRIPPSRFRPGSSYSGSYDVSAGREARRRAAAALARAHNLTMLADWPMPSLGVDCYVMQVAAGTGATEVAEAVSQDPRAEWAQPMRLFRSLGHDDPLYPLQPAASAWHLDDLHRVATGRRVVIAELDSGVEVDHPDLAGQVKAAENLITGTRYAGETHGTAVAGIVAAIADNGKGIAGVAPGARLLVLRACWQNGDSARCSSFTLARALQIALDRGVQVINLSITGPPDKLLAQLLDVALARGITVVTAIDPSVAQGGFPASHPGVLAIAADDPGAGPWLLAPGRDIPTTLPGARWGFVSGSSFAAAHVSGLVALVLEYAPALTPQQIRTVVSSVTTVGVEAQRVGRIDPCAVFTRLTGTCTCSCASAARSAGVSSLQ
ncbi:MAG TPA: S8 family serine peptidase [Burkholderiaceae bacterium]|nr:S8 family serine peptidase [Burkholderiaceae bacterium]